jgi:CheY-like chemotaxis protein
LIVDDIDMNRYVIKEILRSKFGLNSDEATNGKDCLKVIKERSISECCGNYKVIFMDFEMPIMNGLEVLLIFDI